MEVFNRTFHTRTKTISLIHIGGGLEIFLDLHGLNAAGYYLDAIYYCLQDDYGFTAILQVHHEAT